MTLPSLKSKLWNKDTDVLLKYFIKDKPTLSQKKIYKERTVTTSLYLLRFKSDIERNEFLEMINPDQTIKRSGRVKVKRKSKHYSAGRVMAVEDSKRKSIRDERPDSVIFE